jgi:peptide deformylase
MVKPTVQIGNPVIRAKSKNVANPVSVSTKRVIANLIDSMKSSALIGMAAPQIGAGLQIFITQIRKTRFRKNLKFADPLRVFINPKIISHSQAQSLLMEGCGSLVKGQIFGPVKRPSKVTVRALDENGQPFTLTATGLLAKVIQHEYDHLQGIVIIDKFTDTKKVFEVGEYRKNQKK